MSVTPNARIEDAVRASNTLQTNFASLSFIPESAGGLYEKSVPLITEWLDRIGYKPADLNKLNVIHIAGTKGKGSTCAMIASILSQYQSSPLYRFPTKIGRNDSHLRTIRERVTIDGNFLSKLVFARYFFEVWDRMETSAIKEGRDPNDKPSYSMFFTIMAFHICLSEGVDTLILEPGAGGEYDRTNVIEKPTVTGITSLGIDHVNILGDTIEKIAWQKAGIIKPGAVIYTVPQSGGALQVIKNRAVEKGTEMKVVELNPAIEAIKLGLRGEIQKVNASLAVAVVLEHLRKMGVLKHDEQPQGLTAEIKAGLEKVVWPGRCEVRADGKGVEWCMDIAHNFLSMEVASTWFAEWVKDGTKASRRILMFNQQTRDGSALVKIIHRVLSKTLSDPLFDHAIFCKSKTFIDGYKPELISLNDHKVPADELQVQRAIAQTWKSLDSAKVHVVGSIEEAVKLVRQLRGGDEEEEVVAFVTGGVSLVGGLHEVLDEGI